MISIGKPAYYAQIFTYYAFEQCSKKFPIMLNIMPIKTAISYATVHIQFLITRSAQLSSRLLRFNFYQESSSIMIGCIVGALFLPIYYAQYLRRNLVPHFVPSCGLITTSQKGL